MTSALRSVTSKCDPIPMDTLGSSQNRSQHVRLATRARADTYEMNDLYRRKDETRKLMCIAALTLFILLAVPVRLAA
jgi:hypothetical protein